MDAEMTLKLVPSEPRHPPGAFRLVWIKGRAGLGAKKHGSGGVKLDWTLA